MFILSVMLPNFNSIVSFTCQHGYVVANALRGALPMQDNKRISDAIGALQIENQPCSCMLHRQKAAHQVGRKTDQHIVVVVQPGKHRSDD
jgi:hypothetical protein